MDDPVKPPRSRFLVWLEWTVTLTLVGTVVAYMVWKPLDPMGDPKAAQALGLVQTHAARSAETIKQAIDAVMQANRKPDRSPSISDWTVRPEKGSLDGESYRVRVVVRLPGDQAHRWLEWEYLWRVELSHKAVIPLSRPAVEIMP
jgi:hypothetical protein